MVWVGEEAEDVFVVELAAVEGACYVDAALDLFIGIRVSFRTYFGVDWGMRSTSSANTEVSVALICCTFAG